MLLIREKHSYTLKEVAAFGLSANEHEHTHHWSKITPSQGPSSNDRGRSRMSKFNYTRTR
jgi:hypothetical protein